MEEMSTEQLAHRAFAQAAVSNVWINVIFQVASRLDQSGQFRALVTQLVTEALNMQQAHLEHSAIPEGALSQFVVLSAEIQTLLAAAAKS